MHKSSKKLNRQQNKDVPYTPDPNTLFSTASSRAPGLFQNAYVMDRDLGPFFC